MKIKMKSTVAHGIVVTVNNYYNNNKPYRTIEDTDGSIIFFYSQEEYNAFKEYKREEQK